MAALSGTAGSVVAAGTVVGEMAEWSLDLSHSPVEVTSFGDNWQEYIASIRGATGSFSGNFDSADTMQGVLVNSMLGGSAVALKLYVSTTKYFNIGTALLTGQTNGISVAGKGEASWNFQVSGPVTFV